MILSKIYVQNNDLLTVEMIFSDVTRCSIVRSNFRNLQVAIFIENKNKTRTWWVWKHSKNKNIELIKILLVLDKKWIDLSNITIHKPLVSFCLHDSSALASLWAGHCHIYLFSSHVRDTGVMFAWFFCILFA